MFNSRNRFLNKLLIVVACMLAMSQAAAGDSSGKVVQLAKKAGPAYAQLSAEWWQYWADLPPGINPATIPPGPIDCMANQRGPVWFIPSPPGFGPLEFSCTIKRRHLFFPLITQIFFNDPLFPPPFTLEEKRQILDFNEQFLCGRAFLDGVQTSRTEPTVFIASTVFTYESGVNGMPDVFGIGPGEIRDDETVASGYYVLLPPLSRGEHTLRIVGGLGCTLEDGEPEFLIIDNTYHLTVIGGRRDNDDDDEDEDEDDD